ncbi:hypothetical protein ES703_125913 [subsurface metagenome]
MKRHPEGTMNKIAIIVISLILAIAVGLGGCVTVSPPTAPAESTPAPTPMPTPTPTPVPVRDDSFTIRVTGSIIVYDDGEHARRSEGWEEEYNRLLDQVIDMSPAEYDQYSTPEGRIDFWAEYNEKYPAYWDDLFLKSPVVEFSGHYMVITSGGKSSSLSVDGRTPTEYTVRGDIVSCVFQKMSEGGSLKVEILCEGTVVASASTIADYGMVSVATD